MSKVVLSLGTRRTFMLEIRGMEASLGKDLTSMRKEKIKGYFQVLYCDDIVAPFWPEPLPISKALPGSFCLKERLRM